MEKLINNISTTLRDDEKWQAVINCDSRYDGVFFYGVKTTGVFCRPSCRSKKPFPDNIAFFDSAADAIKSGFRPCKRCCPDKAAPEPGAELASKARDILDKEYCKHIDFVHISKQLGVSASHLARLFKRHYGFTPAQYAAKKRVEEAAELLSQTDLGILEISHRAGFQSLSNFYKYFKRHTGDTPDGFRKQR